jgi:hypothetical protein
MTGWTDGLIWATHWVFIVSTEHKDKRISRLASKYTKMLMEFLQISFAKKSY